MRLVTYRAEEPRTGIGFENGAIYDLRESLGDEFDPDPGLQGLIETWSDWADVLDRVVAEIERGSGPDPLEDVTLMAPFPAPRRGAFAAGGNYLKHAQAAEKTTGMPLTKRKGPVFFIKPTTSFVGPNDDIQFDPTFTSKLDYDVELGVVIGRSGRDISIDTAMDHVFGFMVVNDVSARDLMMVNKPANIDYFRGKGLDTFFPIGPGVTPRKYVEDYRQLTLRTRVNGELRQEEKASEMVRDVPELIAELSRSITLQPGDILATGTPAGVTIEQEGAEYLKESDLVECSIDRLGDLANTVRERSRGQL